MDSSTLRSEEFISLPPINGIYMGTLDAKNNLRDSSEKKLDGSPSQSTANWSSSTLRSEESLNTYRPRTSYHINNFSQQTTDNGYYSTSFPQKTFLSERSVEEEPFFVSCGEKWPYSTLRDEESLKSFNLSFNLLLFYGILDDLLSIHVFICPVASTNIGWIIRWMRFWWDVLSTN